MDPPSPFLAVDRPMRQMLVLPLKEDAIEFLNREERLWSWIDQAEHSHSQINTVLGNYRPGDWVQRFRNALTKHSHENFEQIMRTRYRDEQCLCGLDLEAQALASLAGTDKTVGYVALAAIHGQAPAGDQNFMRDIRNRIGVAHGSTFLAGLNPVVVTASKHALMESRNEIEAEAQRMRALVIAAKADATESAQQVAAAAHALAAGHEEVFTKAEGLRIEEYQRLKEELEATAKAFEVRMELQAPVAYWKKRANQYKTASCLALAILVVFAFVAVCGLYFLHDAAASHLPIDSTTIPYAALFRASTFALLMTSIAFWAGRVLLRIYLSTRHLATDAEERRTMITTFLALTKKSVLTDEDRKFILAPLFRPGADGIVHEEAAPDTMFAAMMGSILKR